MMTVVMAAAGRSIHSSCTHRKAKLISAGRYIFPRNTVISLCQGRRNYGRKACAERQQELTRRGRLNAGSPSSVVCRALAVLIVGVHYAFAPQCPDGFPPRKRIRRSPAVRTIASTQHCDHASQPLALSKPYTQSHTHTHTHTHTSTQDKVTSVQADTHRPRHIHAYTPHTHTHAHTQTHRHTQTHSDTHTLTRTHTHTQLQTYKQTHTDTQTDTHTWYNKSNVYLNSVFTPLCLSVATQLQV